MSKKMIEKPVKNEETTEGSEGEEEEEEDAPMDV